MHDVLFKKISIYCYCPAMVSKLLALVKYLISLDFLAIFICFNELAHTLTLVLVRITCSFVSTISYSRRKTRCQLAGLNSCNHSRYAG